MNVTVLTVRRVIVTGSRDWADRDAIAAALATVERRAVPGHRLTLVHGGQRGADAYAHSWVRGRSAWLAEVHPADWSRYGRAAGPRRNAEMIALGADVCVAFILNRSRGATLCADMAERAGIPVWRITR